MEGMGYKVYMTRNEDVFIPLGVRVAKARKLNADLFISIHADAFTSPSARGTGVYTLSTKGASSAAAKFLAQTQNNADAIGGVKTGGNKDIDSTILDMTQTVTNKDSAILGKKVLNELGKYNKLHKGDIDQANFAVLRAPDIPSILVETAFLSNPEEERKLSGMVFRRSAPTRLPPAYVPTSPEPYWPDVKHQRTTGRLKILFQTACIFPAFRYNNAPPYPY